MSLALGSWASLACCLASSTLIPCPGQGQIAPKTGEHGHVLPVEMGCSGLAPMG